MDGRRMKGIWPTVHAELRSLADDLAPLSADQWATPSLCDGWDVHDVLAHLVGNSTTTRVGFMVSFARAGFDFDRMAANEVAAERRPNPADTLAAFRLVCGRTSGPPAPLITRVIEACVHGEDIRRPLGIAHTYPVGPVGQAITYFTKDRLSGGRARLDGLTLIAIDADFTVGSGPEVEGPAMSLLLAASGRRAALADLSGPGVRTLAERG
jgi:uncharacterized protein (TIGR03083 family)